jgi:hypothetical protein
MIEKQDIVLVEGLDDAYRVLELPKNGYWLMEDLGKTTEIMIPATKYIIKNNNKNSKEKKK